MILHVVRLDKFLPSFIEMVNENFDQRQHRFLCVSASGDYPVKPCPNFYPPPRTTLDKISRWVRLLGNMHSAKKIVLHGLLDWRVIVMLGLCPWLLKKSYWVMWGSDLYVYEEPKTRLASKCLEWFRARVIKRMAWLLTYIEGDVELARRWYGAQGTQLECLMYQSNVYQSDIGVSAPQKAGSLSILVGNSADPSNAHFEILDKLFDYRHHDIRLFVPLSYGDRNYAQRVAAYARSCFGDKAEPMFKFMPFEQYRLFLEQIDVAIFNHRRQQAMGNTIALLGAGKTVYLRRDMSHGRMLAGLGVTFFDISEFSDCLISDQQAWRNREIIKSYFSESTLISQWAAIFGAPQGVFVDKGA